LLKQMRASVRTSSTMPQAQDWDDLAELDPLWAVLSEPAFTHGGGSVEHLRRHIDARAPLEPGRERA